MRKRDKKFGFGLLVDQILDNVQSEVECIISDAEGDSEIEKLFDAALRARMKFAPREYCWLLRPETEEAEKQALADTHSPDLTLIVRRQAVVGPYRVDFLIHALDCKESHLGENKRVWRRLVVECDGHDFHERTKEQASRDKSRDRHLVCEGYEVFRFTGSELWRDPSGAIEQVFDWAAKGWY